MAKTKMAKTKSAKKTVVTEEPVEQKQIVVEDDVVEDDVVEDSISNNSGTEEAGSDVSVTEGGGKKKNKKDVDDTNNPVSVYVGKLNNYVERITTMNKELKELVNVGKSLEKDFNNIVRIMSKKNKNKSNEKRHPSGFAVPYKLSDELYTFLNINKGEKVPRNDVTRMINEYITKNELRDTKDKRIIKPNNELHKIFNSSNNDSITYFNLQSYIKHHFIKG